jgi:hypothetical protein
MRCPVSEGRVGGIRHQNSSLNLNFNKKIAHLTPRYTKLERKEQMTAPLLPSQTQRIRVEIKEMDDLQLIKYWNKHPKLTYKSTSS